MTGYPGVSVIDGAGAVVQRPANRMHVNAPPVTLLTLAAGGTGYFVLSWYDREFPVPDCPSAFHGTGLRVYPPNNTDPIYVNFTDAFCDLGVGPVSTS
ncbi:MAG: hypothetical protein JWM76_3915 [Pseudonocardiales bacterium]|nr:hypothetical protein [Pseudonocardiales bacterium]